MTEPRPKVIRVPATVLSPVATGDEVFMPEPAKTPEPGLHHLTGKALEEYGHSVNQRESEVSGPVYDIESRLKDMTVGDILKTQMTAQNRLDEIEDEMMRRASDINRVRQAITRVLKGEA